MPGNSTPRDIGRNPSGPKSRQASPPLGEEGIRRADYDSARPGRDPDTLQHSVQALTALGSQYFLPEAMELLRRTNSKPYLSDDEILLLVVTAVQAARARHSELGEDAAESTLQTIVRILDHEEVIRAEYNKLYSLFRSRKDEEPLAKKRN